METPTYNNEPFWFRHIGLVCMAILTAAFIQLNVQKILYATLSIDTADRASHIVLLLWLLAPALSWLFAIIQLIHQRSFTYTEQCLWAFSILLLLHACATMVYYGLIPAVISFLAWGAWLPIYFISTKCSSIQWVNFFVFILIIGGILQAIPVLYEFFADEVIFKRSTVGAVTRLYGINQSISVLGTQLAIGAIACIYWFIAISNRFRFFPAILFCILCFSLFAISSRGPLLFLSIVLVSFLAASFISRKIRLELMGVIAIFLALFVFTFGFFHSLDISVTNKAAMRSTASYSGEISYESQPANGGNKEQLHTKNLPVNGEGVTISKPAAIVDGSQNEEQPHTKLVYLKSSLSSSDQGNASRIEIYLDAYDYFTNDFASMLIGHGAGKLSQLSYYIDQKEMGTESSIIKLFLELGLLGGALAISIIVSVILCAMNSLQQVNRKMIPFLGMAALIIMEAAIHEILKSWLMLLYLWLIISSITIIANNRINTYK